ncbi:MAG TPA: STAS domain-containing protein [Candidatus Cybelea sp.]|jgi:anti-anti-sigma factor|nr:STAS domain-containing protein [Candidatus Cybelea sp.]
MSSLGSIVMVFSGEYDLASKEQLREAFAVLVGAKQAVLDFNDVSYLDSTALSELTALHRARAAAGLDPATIVTSNGNILRLFQIVDMQRFFVFTDTMPENARGEPVDRRHAPSF